MMVLFTAAGYLAVRAFAPQSLLNGLTFGVGVTTAIVTVLYVLNIFNIDLIGTYADTAVVERAQFFSTLGQKNFCSGFMAFALPLVFYAFLVARGVRHTILYGIPAFFGGLALAVVDAEGARWHRRSGAGAALPEDVHHPHAAAAGGHRRVLLLPRGGDAVHAHPCLRRAESQCWRALGRNGGEPGLCSALSFWAALRFGLRGREVPLYRLGRCVAAAVVATAAVLFLLANLWPGFPSLGRLDEVLIVNDDWGTYRGTAWRITAASWLDQPLWRKLLGVGPGMMHTAVANWAGADITDRMKTFLCCAQ